MIKVRACFCAIALGAAGVAGTTKSDRLPPPFPMPELVAPTFPITKFNILDYAAVAGGKTKNTAAFAKAIAACHQAGGGSVIVPAGIWFTGPTFLTRVVKG